MSKAIIISFLFLIVFCFQTTAQSSDEFDKKRWREDYDYRFYKCNMGELPSLEGKSKRQIIKLLGNPDYIEDKYFIYCCAVQTNKEAKDCEDAQLIIPINRKRSDEESTAFSMMCY